MYSYFAFGLHILSDIILPELQPSEAIDHDLRIRVAPINLPPTFPTQIYRRGIQAAAAKADQVIYLYWPNVAKYQAIQGKELLIDPLTDDANLLSLFTVSEALGLILFQRGLFLLHASAVQVGEQSWCFMGTPGAGKSTTAAAFIKAGCRLLSDDLTAISFQEGMPHIIPAYPQLKIWNRTVSGLGYATDDLEPVSEGVDKFAYHPRADFPQAPLPLGRVYFLHKNEITDISLSAADVPGEMLKNFPLPSEFLTPEILQTHFLQSLQIVRQASVTRKVRPEGFDALEKWVSDALNRQSFDAPHA